MVHSAKKNPRLNLYTFDAAPPPHSVACNQSGRRETPAAALPHFALSLQCVIPSILKCFSFERAIFPFPSFPSQANQNANGAWTDGHVSRHKHDVLSRLREKAARLVDRGLKVATKLTGTYRIENLTRDGVFFLPRGNSSSSIGVYCSADLKSPSANRNHAHSKGARTKRSELDCTQHVVR